MTRDEARSKGGKAVALKYAPPVCPHTGEDGQPDCAKEFPFATPWHEFLGHLGLHGLADNRFNGDTKAAQRHLQQNGLASQDPAPWNNAWPKYKPLPPKRKPA